TELDRAAALGVSEDETVPVGVAMLLSQGRYQAVVDRYAEKVLPTPQPDAQLRVQVAGAYRALGRRDDALAQLQQALTEVTGHAPALALQGSLALDGGDVAAARKVAESLLKTDPAMVEALLLQGDVLAHAQADTAGAVRAYRQAVQARPRSLEAHGRIITLLVNSGDIAEAEKQVAALAKALPGRPLVVFYQALVAYLRNDMPRVRELTLVLQRALPLPQVHFLAGMAEKRLGSLAQAETLLAKVVRALPTAPEPIIELASLYLDQARATAALEILKPLLSAPSPHADALRIAGQAYAQVGDFRAADAAFAKAAQIRPGDARLRTSQAFSLLQRGDAEAGIRELRSAAAADAQGSTADLALVAAEMRRGNVPGALVAVDALERKQPDQPLPNLLRGRIHRSAGDAAAARQAYERVLARDAQHPQAVAELVSLDLAEQKTASVRKRFEAMLKNNPRAVPALMGLADLERREGKPAATAFAWVDKAVKASPLDPEVWKAALAFHREMGDGPALLARARDALGAVPDDSGLMLQIAEAQLAGGDSEQAVASFNRVIKLDSDNYSGHLRLAQLHLANRNLRAARIHAEHARKLQPDALPPLRLAVALARIDGGPDAAAPIVADVQRRLPDAPLGWVLEAEVALTAGQPPVAVAAFRKALQKQESTATAIQLHRALIGAKRHSEAEDFAAEWLRKHATDFAFVSYLGEDASQRQDWPAAEVHLRLAAKLRPDAAPVLNNLAYALVQRKDPQALALARQAVQLVPWSSAFMDTLASAHAAAGEVKSAIEWQDKAVTLAPQNRAYRLQLARFYLTAGQKGKAREALEVLERQGVSGAAGEDLQKLLQQTRG
ncbi:MAG TPA: XrtA/PEP-CTERM system TPR-repeat protein PrsT, partial [Rubrivivax sp.]|nr:XrtA/PEP-CTERM system TPR-repeat protein PrsT [Rubrivivax sp.]